MISETGEDAEQQELEAQMQAATEMVEGVIHRMLREGEIHPQLIVLAVARAAGGLTAAAALAGNQDVEQMLGDVADVMHQAGHVYHDALRAEMMPVAGNA